MQNGQFGSKIKNPKNMSKTILQEHWSCCVQKTARKNIKYSRNETILKIGHLTKAIAHAKAIAFANGQFGSKIKNPKNMFKTILQEHWSCCVQKTVRKKIKYSRNETILKIGHLKKPRAHAKAIAFAKWSVWVKNYKCQKHVKNHSTRALELFCVKNCSKSTKYWRNETTMKIGHLAKAIAHAKAIAFAKWSVWVKNYKCQKHVENHSTRALELFCVKNYSKKHQVLKK